uniref:Uncharacterized protein n=1 Tax=viral metagenome TaxID=1070528 RepID=A0A6C0C535_9ZZZZ
MYKKKIINLKIFKYKNYNNNNIIIIVKNERY